MTTSSRRRSAFSDSPNFRQTETPFDDDGIGDHAAESYFRHRGTIENVWRPIGAEAIGAQDLRHRRRPSRRALSKHPSRKTAEGPVDRHQRLSRPEQRLEGCVNDVFMMSAVLQDCGFPPKRSASASMTRNRRRHSQRPEVAARRSASPAMSWSSTSAATARASPSTAMISSRDHHVESLVPWDFDWSPRKARRPMSRSSTSTASSPTTRRLIMIFDCCHSGGHAPRRRLRAARHRAAGRHPASRAQVGQQDQDVGQPRLRAHQREFTAREGRGGRVLRTARVPRNAWAAPPCCAVSRPRSTRKLKCDDAKAAPGTLSAAHHRGLQRGGVLLRVPAWKRPATVPSPTAWQTSCDGRSRSPSRP